ncbi:MAG: cohesin domain-containing protein [Chloroflexi bacterium]|nr:cohesin domain-containing protein [Chloroflexota bacterium]
MVLESYSEAVETGQEFQLTVKVEAGHTRPVDAAQIYLDFDHTTLEVVAIRPGPHLGYLLQSSWDNSRGRLAYAAGTLGNPLEFPFTFCNVVFRAKAPTVRGSTLVQFEDLRPPRQSKAIYRGLDVTGHLTSVRIRVR